MAACFRYIVNDVNAAIEFYTKHLGFKLEMHPAPPFAEISRGDMHIYLTQPFRMGGGAPMPSGEQQKPGGWNRVHLVVEDLDTTIAQLKEVGLSLPQRGGPRRRRQANSSGRSFRQSR